MRYTLLLHYPERAGDISDEEVRQGMNSFDKWAKDLNGAGALVSAEMFQHTPETTTVQLVNETIQVNEGPADDVPDPIGGVVVIDVADHGDAVYWAKHAPSLAWGPVEIRGGMVRFTEGEWHPVVEHGAAIPSPYDSEELREVASPAAPL